MLETFLNNFWSSFWAGVCVAGLFSILFVRMSDYYKRPKLTLVLVKGDNEGRNLDCMQIRIRNNGRTTLKQNEINWHLYISSDLDFDFLCDPNKILHYKAEFAGNSEILGKEYKHYRNYNIDPTFSEREITILKLRLKNLKGKRHRIYYHFSSVVGLQPRRVWKKFWYRKIAEKNGDIRLEFLPYVEIDPLK